jgi:hypothetical protein
VCVCVCVCVCALLLLFGMIKSECINFYLMLIIFYLFIYFRGFFTITTTTTTDITTIIYKSKILQESVDLITLLGLLGLSYHRLQARSPACIGRCKMCQDMHSARHRAGLQWKCGCVGVAMDTKHSNK